MHVKHIAFQNVSRDPWITSQERWLELSRASGGLVSAWGALHRQDGRAVFEWESADASADANADGRVSLQEALSWVGPRVARSAKRDGKTQTPSIALGPAVLPSDKLYLATGLETP